VLQNQIPATVSTLKSLGTLGATNRLNLVIALPLRNPAALSNLLRQVYDPVSPRFHHYLTPAQFTADFGPSQRDYDAVIAFAQASHLQVTGIHPNRMLLDVSGTPVQVEEALHVTMQTYRHPTENRTFYAPNRAPSLNLSVPILHIGGLDNFALPKPLYRATRLITPQVVPSNESTARPNSGSGPAGTYKGKDFRAAYAPDTALNGAGQTVGLLEFDGYTLDDITYYEAAAGLPDIPIQNVLLDGFSGNPAGNGGEVEVSVDLEMAISMATNLSQIIVYEAGPYGNWYDLLNRMANDDLANQLSCSWYTSGGAADPVADQIFQQMALQGQSFFAASGDFDAYHGQINFPGDTPYITEVGGTTLTTPGPGGPWVAETVWNPGNGTGSSGGISTQYPIPVWQTNISMTANQGSTTMRNTPDVALTADNVYLRVDGVDYSAGGTSCAAPLWAGFAALVNQQAAATGQSPIGFINPALDAIGSGPNYTAAFHDITTGNNTSPASPSRFYAVAGYDLCTGWGTPAGQKLINALANPEPLRITPASGFSAVGGVGGPFFPVPFQNFSLTNSGTNSLTWTLSNTCLWLNASSVGGTLPPQGPAAGVTVNLNDTASNLTVGAYAASIFFTNVTDGAGQSRAFTLSIISPPGIALQPTNASVVEGTSAAFSVQAGGGLPLVYQWQFNGTNLTDGGNISGSATTNLSISNVSPADAGNYSVIITNFAGTAVSSNAVLTLVPSPPIIVSQPAGQTVYANVTVSLGVDVIGTSPCSYQWLCNSTNLSGATNTTLVLTNVQVSQSGGYSVTITNIYGGTNSALAQLTVMTPPLCDPPPAGIVAWWQGESNALDTIGGNNGTLMNGTGFAPGEVGTAFNLNGVNNYIVANPSSPSNLDVGQGSGLTFEEWIHPNTIGREELLLDYERALGTHSGADVGIGLAIIADSGGFLNANLTDTNDNNHVFSTPGNLLAPGVWQHIAMTYDKASGVAMLYINGNAVTVTNFGTFTPQTSFTNVVLGARTTFNSVVGPGAVYSGELDEITLYGRALSSSEIQAIYLAGSYGKCSAPAAPAITSEPTNQSVAVGGTALFSVTAGGTPPLWYQWSFNCMNLNAATNAALSIANVQLAGAGTYAVTVTNAFGVATSSNATLFVIDVLDHFTWGMVPTPRFASAPFGVTLRAMDSINQPFTNFTGSVALSTLGGPPVAPAVSGNFVRGAWSAPITIAQTGTNLVLEASDGLGHSGQANPVTVLAAPALTMSRFDNILLLYWPAYPSNFVLECATNIVPPQWTPVGGSPYPIGDQNLDLIQIGNSNQFYRLRYTLP
jgi:hypothetical protein